MSVKNCELPFSSVNENKLICATDSVAADIKKSMPKTKSIFVTVGTTRFDKLITTFNRPDFQSLLLKLGYEQVSFQIGTGLVEPLSCSKLRFRQFRFCAEGLSDELANADLVVSHAGAGTVLETCRAHRRLVVVVNDALMHNHQTELALEFARRRHCVWATPDSLMDVLMRHSDWLRAGVSFDSAFVGFQTDYYENVARAIEELF